MKIGIIGTGAMGSLFAALLSPLAKVVMIGSWGEQLQIIGDRGLLLHHLDGHTSRQRITTTAHASEAAPCDIALVLVKSWQTEIAARRAQMALEDDGLAVTLQNGLGNFETLTRTLGRERVVQGVTSEGATVIGPGEVRHAGRGHTHLAASSDNRGKIETLAALFNQAEIAASIVSDAQGLIWGKLAVNAGINPLTALLQVPNGYLVQNAMTLEIMRRAALEVAAVAAKLKIDLPFDDAAHQAATVALATAGNRSSMAQDIARGMPTEIEQISGAVVERGRSVAVPTPVNEALLHLVRAQVSLGDWRSSIRDLQPELQALFCDVSKLESST